LETINPSFLSLEILLIQQPEVHYNYNKFLIIIIKIYLKKLIIVCTTGADGHIAISEVAYEMVKGNDYSFK
jgi:hypothetical protein